MGEIVLPAEYDGAVRHPLGVTSLVIADTVIEGLAFLPFVEGEVQELVTDWATLLAAANQDANRLKLATGYWTAARLCGHLERTELEDYAIVDYRHGKSGVDWRQKAQELAREAAKMLALISTQTPASRPALFTRTGPTRAGTNSPTAWQTWLEKIQPTVVTWLLEN